MKYSDNYEDVRTSHRAHRCESGLVPIPEIGYTTNPEQLILSKTYPTIGYTQPTYLDMYSFLAGGLFCRKTSIVGSLLSIF